MTANDARSLERARENRVIEEHLDELYSLIKSRVEFGVDEVLIPFPLGERIVKRLESDGYSLTFEDQKTTIGW